MLFSRPRIRKINGLFSLKQGFTLAAATFGALIVGLAAMPSAHALSFAPGTEFLPYKNKRACVRNGGNYLRWQGEVYCTRAQQRPTPQRRVNSYRSCAKAGGRVIKLKPPICLWQGRYFTAQKTKPPKPKKPKPIVIRNYKQCVDHGGRIHKTRPRSCSILGQTFYKKKAAAPKPITYKRTFRIGAYYQSCRQHPSGRCLMVNGKPFAGKIRGFQFRRGFQKTITVKVTDMRNVPGHRGPAFIYEQTGVQDSRPYR